MLLLALAGPGLGAAPASPSVHAIAGPAMAPPSRDFALPDSGRTGLAAPAVAPALLQASAQRLGLSLRSLPPRRAQSLGLDPMPLAARDPVAASLRVMDSEPALVGLPAGQFEATRVDRTPRMTYVHLREIFRGLPILGSRVGFQWDRANRLAQTTASVYDLRRLEAEPPTGPRISLAEARSTALSGLGADARVVGWLLEEQAWLPVDGDDAGAPPPSATSPDSSAPPDTRFRLIPVWLLRFTTEIPSGFWEVWIDASSGTLLSRRDLLVTESLSGDVLGDVEPTTAYDPEETRPFSDLFVTAAGADGGPVVSGATGADGGFSLEVPSPGRYQLRVEMKGRAAWVRDGSDGLRTPFDTLSAAVPSDVELRWTDRNSTASERDAYYHGTRAYHRVREIDPGEALSRLDEGIEFQVDHPEGTCNAFWNGLYLRFYAAGSFCGIATAQIADVVYHEYQHAVTQYIYDPYLPPADMNEGFSDYFAASLSDTSIIGKGFLGAPGTFLREIETDRVWPVDANPDPHLQGLILSGALWDLRKVLGKDETDELFHFARYAKSMSFDDYLLDLLAYDDDDGDLTDGTPHFGPIIAAFRAHGIGDYSVHIEADPLPDVEIPGPSIEARARISALLGLDPASLTLFYAVGDDEAFDPLPLVPTEVPREYAAEIPSPTGDAEVRYYWSAADTAGHQSVFPTGAPEETFTFHTGLDRIAPVIRHEPEEVLTEDRSDFLLRAQVTDNSGRVGDVRARYQREGSDLWSETPLLPVDGGGDSNPVYEGSLELGGDLAPGDAVLYSILAQDQAVETNTSRLPETGDFRVEVRRGRFLDFETGPGPLEATGDWEWGTPQTGVIPWSGERVWATRLGGPYSHDTRSTLVWGPLDLSDYDRARLEFRHFYRFESGSDGGQVQVSTDHEQWQPLYPDGDYPAGNVTVFDGPGYSDVASGWTEASFPLDLFLGRTVWIRWEAASDAFVADLGWYLDDVTIVGAQDRAVPLDFRVLDGTNFRVELSWNAPPGVDLSSPRFLGYNLYRTVDGQPLPGEPLLPAPLRETRYVDTDVENDVTYRYRLRAVYDEGESRPLELTGTPAAPAIGFDVSEVDYRLDGIAESDTTFFIRNLTGGRLEFDVFLAEKDWDVEQARVVQPLDELSDRPRTILEDARDANGNADLRSVSVRRWESPELGPMIEFRLRGYAPWGNPLEDWGGVLLLDTDENLATRPEDYTFGWDEDINIGWEYAVLFGRLPKDLAAPVPALFLRGCCLDEPYRPLEVTSFPENADSLSFSFPLEWLGPTQRIQPVVLLSRGLDQQPFDRAPERPDLPWLVREPRHGRARPSVPQPFSLQFDARGLGNGTYQAKVFLETNDLQRPLITLPIRLEVEGIVPENPSNLAFQSTPDGVEIEFSMPSGLIPDAAEIERQSLSEGIWRRLTAEALAPGTDGYFRFEDRSTLPGETYSYRFHVRLEDDRVISYGPYEVTYHPPVPGQLTFTLAGPNPFQDRVALRLGTPAPGRVTVSVFDALGRRVRVLLDENLPAGGGHLIEWDGRNQYGEPAPTGIYWARVAAATGERTLRLVRLR